MIAELTKFANEFKDDDDEPSLMQKIKEASRSIDITQEKVDELQEEIDRVVKMFYLQMKVKGQLKPLKDDYFI